MIPKDELEAFVKKVHHRYPKINYGGCCVFAALLGKCLELHYPVRVIVFGYNDKSLHDIRKLVSNNVPKEWSKHGIDFSHVVLEYTDENLHTWHVDSTGIFRTDGSIYWGLQTPGYLTVAEAAELASVQEGWNREFNRDVIPNIDRMVRFFFSKHSAPLVPVTENWIFNVKQFLREMNLTLKNINNFKLKWG